MNPYIELIQRIIKAQESIIGPVAIEQAKKVHGLSIDDATIKISGNEKEVINQLVKQYEGIFGQASIEVCKNAVRDLTHALSKEQLPQLLQ